MPRNARQGHDAFKAQVAPAVARQVENPHIALYRLVFHQDGIRNSEQPYLDRRTRFAAGRADPHLFTLLLDVLEREHPQVDIRKSRKTAEQKSVAHELDGRVGHLQPDKFLYLIDRQIVARHELAVQFVVGEEILGQITTAPGQHKNMLQRDHVNPRRVLFMALVVHDVLMEARQELPVELLERQVLAVISVVDVVFEMPVNAPILIISRFAAADVDHLAELLVVLPEKGQQSFPALVVAEIHAFDHLGRHQRLLVEERIVASLNVIADLRQAFVDTCSSFAAPCHTSHAHIPEFRIHRKLCRQLRALSVDRDAAHDGRIPVSQRRILLNVKKYLKRVSHSDS